MLAGIFHAGSGLGDQLFRYITVRSLAEQKGYEWGMMNNDKFKGDFFVDFKNPRFFADYLAWPLWNEKEIRDANGVDIRSYDPEINFVGDNTIIDGSFEDFKYWGHNLSNINNWLKVEPLFKAEIVGQPNSQHETYRAKLEEGIPDDLCIIGFRGGEYATDPNLFLGMDYYEAAIAKMRAINPHMRFQVHTDDPVLARTLFPELEMIDNVQISHSQHTNMGLNWIALRYARYAIISNSAFGILPRNLKHHEDKDAVTIAPRYWARRTMKVWARPACYYPSFTYL